MSSEASKPASGKPGEAWALKFSSVHNGRVALVTGAARGIGLGIAAWLIAEGWQVVLTDLDRARGFKVAGALGENALFIAMDVASEEQVAAGVAEVLRQFGRLDALVCNAAIADPHNTTLESLELSHWNRVLAVNLGGPMLLAKHCAPYLRAHCGSIVNLTSTRSRQSEADTEAYAASKGGLMALTHALAISLGPEIRVNAVSPGWIDARDPSLRKAEPLSETDHAQHPAGRVGTVEDVAAMVAWLLSRNAGFVTGQEFVFDGGMTRKMVYAE
ncbi:SDR family oxidoreductase [Pseudomonas savastanoi pv. phaseolicola]|uniref:Oxidoreductase n=2 Tax=Pseudomonas savastanoi TaxID=29438 RepID=A0A3M4Y424_PSESG|nr:MULTISPECIES: SDR family oxidoreductase [Pseudomonas]KPB86896.1 Oxidoreductase [Pseudomonas syringae pv. maculicola]KPB39573.1 Oxidoreductase [Pseudomonas savastanoi pv. phaseolicola]KPB41868.1 Oxidoreductase [Pseudomonas savastanoi pv. phaseolicola]KPB45042.1 Oxidoreductase [Pseudomonas savastanoi pv. phaseolicola]KPB62742.1 Oxidoreductase [Pseudomonas savastanoi pv. phaseolicola]